MRFLVSFAHKWLDNVNNILEQIKPSYFLYFLNQQNIQAPV